MATNYRQDMPPPGGFESVQIDRLAPKRLFNKGYLILGLAPLIAWSWYHTVQAKKMVRKLVIEKYDALLACEPFLQAERERAFLKQLHKLREDETELMKNVPGWTVGTFYGSPLQRTMPEDTMPNIPLHEYYTHRHPWERYNYMWPDKDNY